MEQGLCTPERGNATGSAVAQEVFEVIFGQYFEQAGAQDESTFEAEHAGITRGQYQWALFDYLQRKKKKDMVDCLQFDMRTIKVSEPKIHQEIKAMEDLLPQGHADALLSRDQILQTIHQLVLNCNLEADASPATLHSVISKLFQRAVLQKLQAADELKVQQLAYKAQALPKILERNTNSSMSVNGDSPKSITSSSVDEIQVPKGLQYNSDKKFRRNTHFINPASILTSPKNHSAQEKRKKFIRRSQTKGATRMFKRTATFMDIMLLHPSKKPKKRTSSIRVHNFTSIALQNKEAQPSVMDGARELFTDLFSGTFQEHDRKTKKNVLDLALLSNDSGDDDASKSESLDSCKAERAEMVKQLINAIYKDVGEDYEMTQAEFIERLFQQIKDDEYFRSGPNSLISGSSEGLTDSENDQDMPAEQPPVSDEVGSPVNQYMMFTPFDEVSQKRTAKFNSMKGSRIAVDLLTKRKRFQVSLDGTKMDLKELKEKHLLGFKAKQSAEFTHRNFNNFEENEMEETTCMQAERLMVEFQDLLEQKLGQNPQEQCRDPVLMRFNEILVSLYKFIDSLEEERTDQQTHVEQLKHGKLIYKAQLKEQHMQRTRETEKNRMSMVYNQQLETDLTRLTLEYNQMRAQRASIGQENQELKEQLQELEEQLDEMNDRYQAKAMQKPITLIRQASSLNRTKLQVEEQKAQKKQLELDLQKANGQIKKLMAGRDQGQAEIQEWKTCSHDLQTRLGKAEEKVHLLQQQIRSLQQANTYFEQKLSRNLRAMRSTEKVITSQKNTVSIHNSLYELECENQYRNDWSEHSKTPSALYSPTSAIVEDHAPNESFSQHYSTHIEHRHVSQAAKSNDRSPMSHLAWEKQENHLSVRHLPTTSQAEAGILDGLIKYHNQQIESALSCFRGTEHKGILSEMPRLDPERITSFQHFSTALIQQQEHLLKKISSFLQLLQEVKAKCQELMAEKQSRTEAEEVQKFGQEKAGRNASNLRRGRSLLVTDMQLNKEYIFNLKDKVVKLKALKSARLSPRGSGSPDLSGQLTARQGPKNIKGDEIVSQKPSEMDTMTQEVSRIMDNEHTHNCPQVGKKTQQEIQRLISLILSKGHDYNLICSPGSFLNQDGGMRLQTIFKNINKHVNQPFELQGQLQHQGSRNDAHHTSQHDLVDISEFPMETFESEDVGFKSEAMDLYSEQVYIYLDKKLVECILVCCHGYIHFLSADGNKPLLPKIQMLSDIALLIKSLKQTSRESHVSGGIQLQQQCSLRKERRMSHIFIVQMQRSNFTKLVDFINYHILVSGRSIEQLRVLKKSVYEAMEVTRDGKRYLFSFQEMSCHKIESKHRAQLVQLQNQQFKEIVLKKVQGIIRNHWINCCIELHQPTAYAFYILKKFQTAANQRKIIVLVDNSSLKADLEQFIVFNFNSSYLSSSRHKAAFVEAVLSKFKYMLELKEGTLHIRDGKVTRKIVLNSSLLIHQDAYGQEDSWLASSDAKPNQFRMEVDGEEHVFAAEGKNVEVYRRWLDKLKQIEAYLRKHEDTYDEKLALVQKTLEQIFDEHRSASQSPYFARKQKVDQSRQIREISSKYKTMNRIGTVNSSCSVVSVKMRTQSISHSHSYSTAQKSQQYERKKWSQTPAGFQRGSPRW